jgi:IK cytokine
MTMTTMMTAQVMAAKTSGRKPQNKPKPWQAKQKDAPKDKAATAADKYRDRAAERRKQGDDLDAVDEATPLPAHTAGLFDERAKTARQAEIERSKYLGGDMAHTHLVKGLDYALLQKHRDDLQKLGQKTGEAAVGGVGGVVGSGNAAAVTGGEKKASSDGAPLSFRTRIGKSIHTAIFERPVRSRNEMFVPGRMAFVFDLANTTDSDVPTALLRSKVDHSSHEVHSCSLV